MVKGDETPQQGSICRGAYSSTASDMLGTPGIIVVKITRRHRGRKTRHLLSSIPTGAHSYTTIHKVEPIGQYVNPSIEGLEREAIRILIRIVRSHERKSRREDRAQLVRLSEPLASCFLLRTLARNGGNCLQLGSIDRAPSASFGCSRN